VTHLARLKGLLGKMKLNSDEGLWTVPSQGIHATSPADCINALRFRARHHHAQLQLAQRASSAGAVAAENRMT